MPYDNLLIVLAVAAGVPFLLAAVPRLPVPGAVLEIVAGVVLGPAVLNVVAADTAVQSLSVIGLGFLLFLAGLEIDIRQLRGPRARLVSAGLLGSVALAAIVGLLLHVAGLAESPLLIGTALVATSLGLLIPILKDVGAIDRPVGQLTIGGASAGEISAVVLLSLLFSEHSSGPGSRLLLLLSLVGLAVLIVLASIQAGRSMWLSRAVEKLADTSAQVRVRLSMLLVVGLSAMALHLALLLVRGLPALAYRAAGLSRADVMASGLLQATSLPVIVAAATIGLKLDAIRPENAAALVAAGLLSVVVFPLMALRLLSRSDHPRRRRPIKSPGAER